MIMEFLLIQELNINKLSKFMVVPFNLKQYKIKHDYKNYNETRNSWQHLPQ